MLYLSRLSFIFLLLASYFTDSPNKIPIRATLLSALSTIPYIVAVNIVLTSGLSQNDIPWVVFIVLKVFVALRCPLTALMTFKFGGRNQEQNLDPNRTTVQANTNRGNEMPIFSIHSM
jgi:hypothetical protein